MLAPPLLGVTASRTLGVPTCAVCKPLRWRLATSLTDAALLALLHLVDLFRHEAVRFAVDPMSRLRVRRLDEAEDLARLLVDPIAAVVDPVLTLDLEVLLMGLRHVVGGDPVADVVNVHEQRHVSSPFVLRS